MEHDITETQDSLRQFAPSQDGASHKLAMLGAEYSSFWQGPSLRDMAQELGVEEKKFLPFGQQQNILFTESQSGNVLS